MKAILVAGGSGSRQFVQTREQRQGLRIACLEEIALLKGFIDPSQLERLIDGAGKNDYAAYLRRVLQEHIAAGKTTKVKLQ